MGSDRRQACIHSGGSTGRRQVRSARHIQALPHPAPKEISEAMGARCGRGGTAGTA